MDSNILQRMSSILYMPIPLYPAFSPDRGPIDGGTLIRISGSNFDGGSLPLFGAHLNDGYQCKLGELRTNATFVNQSLLECTSMPIKEGLHTIEVTLNGQDFTDACVPFTALRHPYLTSHSPTSGLITGDTLVTIRGTHLAYGSDYRCKFEDPNATLTSIIHVTEPTGINNTNITTQEGYVSPIALSLCLLPSYLMQVVSIATHHDLPLTLDP